MSEVATISYDGVEQVSLRPADRQVGKQKQRRPWTGRWR